MVKIVRLNSGEEIMAKITEKGDMLTLKDPCVLVPSEQGKLLFVKWLPYANTSEGVSINTKNVVFIIDPLKELEDHYTGAISNNLFVPSNKKIVTPTLSLA
jgi:hypothetical protein